MSDLFWLSDAQMARLEPYFPKSHGKPRVDDRRVLSEIIFVNRNGLRWRDAPREYGPHKRLYNRWKRWSDKGIFARMMAGLAAGHGDKKNAQLGKTGSGWTTRGAPEGRTGASYDAPHRRRRDYVVDADYLVVLAVESPDADPTLNALAKALVRPERPLFLGRKTCLPTRAISEGEAWGVTVHDALSALDRYRPCLAI